MTEQPRFDDSSELVPHRNFTIPFNYVWSTSEERWVPMQQPSGGSGGGSASEVTILGGSVEITGGSVGIDGVVEVTTSNPPTAGYGAVPTPIY